MRSDNSSFLLAAARERSLQTRQRALRALQHLDTAGTPVTFESVATQASVSRSWLYTQPDLRDEIQQRRARQKPAPPLPLTPQRQRASDTSLLRRLEAATERLRKLEADNRLLRDALAEALGTARINRILGSGTGRDTPGRQSIKTIGPC